MTFEDFKFEGFKVVTAKEMARIEKLSIEEGASGEAYMLHAGEALAFQVMAYVEKTKKEKSVTLVIGKGNNGGDGFVLAIHLLRAHFDVTVYHLFPKHECSFLCQKQREKFEEMGGEVIFPQEIGEIICNGVIVDAILGTGFQGKLKGFLLDVISHLNQCLLPILSIDIPSGINGDNGTLELTAIQAQETFFLGLPKMGFFLEQGYDHIGKLFRTDFKMKIDYYRQAKASAYLLNEVVLRKVLPPLRRTRHKYQAGYVLAVSGSPGMGGAAQLCSLAVLRAGAGIVRLFHPSGMENELSSCPYEIIRAPYQEKKIEPFLKEMERASSLLIGPGMGRKENVRAFIFDLISHITKPTVIDADALFHLKGQCDLLKMPCVLTPHHGEMLYLLDKKQFKEEEMIPLCQDFVEKHRFTLILKGAPTFIFHPQKSPLIVTRGDPGMATAGCGDVLTGIIAGLLAQKLSTREAAVLGVYLHGRAGEYVAKKKSSYHLIASDLLQALCQVFQELVG